MKSHSEHFFVLLWFHLEFQIFRIIYATSKELQTSFFPSFLASFLPRKKNDYQLFSGPRVSLPQQTLRHVDLNSHNSSGQHAEFPSWPGNSTHFKVADVEKHWFNPILAEPITIMHTMSLSHSKQNSRVLLTRQRHLLTSNFSLDFYLSLSEGEERDSGALFSPSPFPFATVYLMRTQVLLFKCPTWHQLLTSSQITIVTINFLCLIVPLIFWRFHSILTTWPNDYIISVLHGQNGQKSQERCHKASTHLLGGCSAAGDLFIGSYILPGDNEGMVRDKVGGCGKSSLDKLSRLLQDFSGIIQPVIDFTSSMAGVNVWEKWSNGREICREVIVHILGLSGEVLSWNDPIGSNLSQQSMKV